MRMKNNYFLLFTLMSLLLGSTAISAKQDFTAAELEKWFNSDEELPVKEVSNEKLIFLKEPPTTKTLHSTINLIVNKNSIDEGWTQMSQCYDNLDPIHVTEVLYRRGFIKKLKIKSYTNIANTKVIDNKILLQGVKKNASLCVTANVRNFYQNEDESFSLVNGPYHRKFLDGYFPYHLTLKIQFSPLLKYSYSVPKRQQGFQIKHAKQLISLNSWFEGKLKTEFRFKLKD